MKVYAKGHEPELKNQDYKSLFQDSPEAKLQKLSDT